MTQTRRNDVNPTDLSEKYQMALQDSRGQWVGLTVEDFVANVKGYPLNQHPPQQKLEQMSFHMGQGVERWMPGNFSYAASKDAWVRTPGKLHSSPLWKWPRGMRDHNTVAPGSVTFKPLLSGAPLGVQFVATAEYSGTDYVGAHNWILLRKGALGQEDGPGTLTYQLRNSGGTVVGSATLAATAVTDVTSFWHDFSSMGTLTNGGTYTLDLFGASTDTAGRCWEIGCGTAAGVTAAAGTTAWASWTATTYSPYYRITDADTARVIWPFPFDSGFYAVTSNDAGGASKLFINGVRGRATGVQTGTTLVDTTYGSYGTATPWATNRFSNAYVRLVRGAGAGQVRQISSNTGGTITVSSAWTVNPGTASGNISEYVVYDTDWWTEKASAFAAPVSGEPAYANGIMYFPMGDETSIVRMHMNYGTTTVHEMGTESSNKAIALASGYISADGPVMWRANNGTAAGTGSAVSVSRANLSGLAWGTDLTFKTSILMGDNTQTINRLGVHTNRLYVPKEDQLFVVENDIPIQVKAGISEYPSRRNGLAMATGADGQLYIGLRHDLFIITGAQITSLGLHRDAGVKKALSGYFADIEPVGAWNFLALDAVDGTSSIWCYAIDTQSFSENVRAFASGRRIRAVAWQPCENTNPRLWFECGGELMYQKYPVYDVRPLNDTSIEYMPECVLETSTIDLLSVDPKYFSTLSAVTKNLASEDELTPGHEIYVEYQLDNDVGTDNWTSAGVLSQSPSDQIPIEEGSSRMIRLRFRLFTSEATTPTILERYGLTLVSRVPIYWGWDILATLDTDDEEQNSLKVIKWLNEHARMAEKLTLTSTNPLYHGKTVMLQNEPLKSIDEYDADATDVSGRMFVRLVEVA